MVPSLANSDEDFEWTPSQQITDTSLGAFIPDISVNPNSDMELVHLAYVINNSDDWQLQYKNSTQFSNDNNIIISNDTFGMQTQAKTCITSNGKVYIVWGGGIRKGFISNNTEGSFSTPTNFTKILDVFYLDAAIDESNNIHIAWVDNHEGGDTDGGVFYMFYNTTSDTFLDPVHIPDTNGNESAVSIDAWNTWDNEKAEILANVHIAFIDEDNHPEDPYGTSDTELRYISNNGNLNTFNSTPVWVTVNNVDDLTPSIAVDKKLTGLAHLVWAQEHISGENTYYRVQYATSANWLAQITPSSLNNDDNLMPDVVIDSNSTAHIVWSYEDLDSWNIQYTFVDEFDCSVPIDITNGSQNHDPTITRDSSNNIHVVWQKGFEANAELYYTKRQPITASPEGGEQTAIPGYSLLIVAVSTISFIYVIGRKLQKSN